MIGSSQAKPGATAGGLGEMLNLGAGNGGTGLLGQRQGSTPPPEGGMLGQGLLGLTPDEFQKLDPKVKKSLLQKALGL